jgi:5'-3' exonuclease
MGIKGLQKYLKKTIPPGQGLTKVPLLKYSGKSIALDFTNFLYKFLLISESSDNYLLEFINIIHKFSKHKIKIIFIFDGKPIDEKQKIIEKRKTVRKVAKEQYENLCKNGNEYTSGDISLDTSGGTSEDIFGDTSGGTSEDTSKETIEDVNIKLSKLRKKSISIKCKHIKNCKYLFDLMGIEWYHIKYIEADIIFKYLFDIGKIDACYSSDMDMLLYKCPILLQDLDFSHDEIYEYKYDNIINYLNLTDDQLLNACIAAGTDFNYPLKHSKIEDNIILIRKYNTIENIINNLEIINLNKLCKIEVPIDFNYNFVFKIYKSILSDNAQAEINNQIILYKKLNSDNFKDKIIYNLKTILLKINSMCAPIKFVYKIQEFCDYKYGFKF